VAICRFAIWVPYIFAICGPKFFFVVLKLGKSANSLLFSLHIHT
jgi:hypothetical protein